MRKNLQIKYDLSGYNQQCPTCKRTFKSNKCLGDHIFNACWERRNNLEHTKLIQDIRKRFQEEWTKKAKHNCPACGKIIIRSLAAHLAHTNDEKHQKVLKKQESFVIKLLKDGKILADIERNKDVFMNNKWILRVLRSNLGKEKASKIIKENFSQKRKEIWASMTLEERKKKMIPV